MFTPAKMPKVWEIIFLVDPFFHLKFLSSQWYQIFKCPVGSAHFIVRFKIACKSSLHIWGQSIQSPAIRPRCTRPESWKGRKLDFLVLEKFSGKMEIFLANTGPSCNPQELPFLCKATAKEMRQRKNNSINQSFFDGEITWYAYVMMWCDGGGGVQMGVATRLFHHHAEPSQPPFRSNIDFSKNKIVPKIG